ncbi:peptidyl-tRNA hydrolase 2, mitochondrial [Aethina tumida]|uniref:peptidyl-tRNA hydrolase 2, mitochondrial n=1 Tax=Aethina tumida TaxID=116153 RepID=UPI0021494AA4|nr:peptidyl-tRNA hydrolase 2, mitochondrial [Aethina tumida]
MGIILLKSKMLGNVLRTLTDFGAVKMVIIVRTDLNMGRGKIASQAAHAAVLLYQSAIDDCNPHLKSWMRYGQPKIVLKVDKDAHNTLENLYKTAHANNLNVTKVCDAGKTQLDSGTLTAVGIGPNKTEDIDQITKDLKLL